MNYKKEFELQCEQLRKKLRMFRESLNA